MGFGLVALIREYGRTLWVVRKSLLTIVAMLGLGYLTRYSWPERYPWAWPSP